jgi:hypothetical protein
LARRSLIPIIPGMCFGRLTVIGPAEPDQWGHTRWECKCTCGNITRVRASHLRSGNTKSCGCLSREKATQRIVARSYRHGNNRSPLHRCWKEIKLRCFNPKSKDFKDYSGRGITIAPAWVNDFLAFKNYVTQHLGPCPKGHSIDRIFNDGNYESANLRWAPNSVQIQNSRRSKLNKALDALILECIKPARRRHSQPTT